MRLILALCLVGLICAPADAQSPLLQGWTRQPGTSASDSYSGHIDLDATGNCYVSGTSRGDFAGTGSQLGGGDAIVVKYDTNGIEQWRRQMGTAEHDSGAGMALDSAGNAYLGGRTYGVMGGPNQGASDAFVMKLDPNGNTVWTAQTGTSYHDSVAGVGLDAAGNSYIGGFGLPPTSGLDQNLFMAKVDPNGQVLWRNDYGPAGQDHGTAMVVDAAGNSYLAGRTAGDYGATALGSGDAFVAKYDTNGNEVWVAQFGSDRDDRAYGVALGPNGEVYAVGESIGVMGPGGQDGQWSAFLTKLDAGGSHQWTQQFGVDAGDEGTAVAVDQTGAIWVAGKTDVAGTTFQPDGFIRQFAPDGQELWAEYFSSSLRDSPLGIFIDSDLTCYVAGYTDGSLFGPSHGESDPFIVTYVPEPTTLAMLALSGVALLRRKRRIP
jgi:hypothetical protein